MTILDVPPAGEAPVRSRTRRWATRAGSVEVLALAGLVAIALRGPLVDLFSSPRAATFVTVFSSVVVAGLPFLVFGALASAAVVAFVPAHYLDRALRARPLEAVAAGAGVGVLLPTGDGAASVAAGLTRRGVASATALAFLLASPAISPVVLVATAVAFPDAPLLVLARFVAGLLTAIALGLLWHLVQQRGWTRWWPPPRSEAPVPARPGAADTAGAIDGTGAAGGTGATGATRATGAATEVERGWPAFWESTRKDVLRAGGVLVLGAAVVAALTVLLPAGWQHAIAGNSVLAVIVLVCLAVLLSLRAEADAFVVAALSQFSLTARLAFLVVGPIANLRLFTRQLTTFGPGFTLRFAPAALLVGLGIAALVGVVCL